MIINDEFIEKAREAKSAGEILALAGENSAELTEEEANELFDRLRSGEFSDDKLEDIAAGTAIGAGINQDAAKELLDHLRASGPPSYADVVSPVRSGHSSFGDMRNAEFNTKNHNEQ